MAAPPPPTAPPPPDASGASGGATDAERGPRRLTRRRRSRLVGGVAAGLADYLGVDPVVVRIGFVVLSFVPFPGFGILVYVAMLLLVPEQDADGAVLPTRLTERTAGFWVGVGLIALATMALIGAIGRFDGLVPLVLIGLGVALWVDADRRNSRPPAADGSTRPTGPVPGGPAAWEAAAWQPPPAPAQAAPSSQAPATPSTSAAPVTDPAAATPGPPTVPVDPGAPTTVGWQPPPEPPAWGGGGQGPPSGPPAPTGPAWTPPPVTRRPRSPLGRLTLGLALLAGAVAWLVDLLGVASVPVASMLAVVLLVLGLGLLVGAVFGRARWLVAVLAVVLPLTLVVAVVEDLDLDLRGGFDSRRITVTDTAQLEDPIAIGAGELTLDLGDLQITDDLSIDASVGVGELNVIVPDGVGLDGRARVELGDLRLPDQRSEGVSVRRSIAVPAEPGQPTITLDLRLGAGELNVRTVPAGAIDETTTEVQP